MSPSRVYGEAMLTLLIFAAPGSSFGGVEVASVVQTVATPAGCTEAGVCYPAGREVITTSGRLEADLSTFNRLRAGDTVFIDHGEVIAREVQ